MSEPTTLPTPRKHGTPKKQIMVSISMSDYLRLRALVTPLGVTVGRFCREATLRACAAAEARHAAAKTAIEAERRKGNTA